MNSILSKIVKFKTAKIYFYQDKFLYFSTDDIPIDQE